MKSKSEKIALAVAIVLLILYIVGAVSLVVFGVKFFKEKVYIIKDSITTDKFISAMKEEGFDVEEITDDVNERNIDEAYRAENGKYVIEFYTFKDEDAAMRFFYDSEDDVDSDTSTKRVSISGKNYSTFTLVKNGRYTFIERVDNTVLIVSGSSKHETDSKNLLKSFGY